MRMKIKKGNKPIAGAGYRIFAPEGMGWYLPSFHKSNNNFGSIRNMYSHSFVLKPLKEEERLMLVPSVFIGWDESIEDFISSQFPHEAEEGFIPFKREEIHGFTGKAMDYPDLYEE